MKLIIVAPEMPFPANTGGRILVYKRIQYLAKNNELFYFGIIDNENERCHSSELQKYCKEVHLYNRSGLKNKVNTLLNIWRGPYACVSRAIKEMRDEISQCFNNNSIDYILVQQPQMLGNVTKELFATKKVVVEQQNIEYVTMRNLADSIKNSIKQCIYKLDAKRMKTWEDKYYTKPILLHTFVSIEDKAFFEQWLPSVKTYLSPIGSELEPFDQPNEGHNIVYFGKMSYYPNAEAAKWFADSVFPLIVQKVPAAKYYIVGKDPLDYLVELSKHNDNIIVTGTVDSVLDYYKLANVVVVPLAHGGGVKVKVLEALGHGKILVSTSKGIEGTEFTNGYDVLTANNAEEMASLISEVLLDNKKYDQIRLNGMKTIEKKYTWAAIIGDFEDMLKGN